jgi:hypothetical protein
MISKIFHTSNSAEKYDINLLNNKEIEIKSGNKESLLFVIKYVNYYSDKIDESPEHPILQDMKLEDLFENELHLFKDLFPTDLENAKRLTYIKNITSISEELNLTILLDKLAVILFHYIVK